MNTIDLTQISPDKAEKIKQILNEGEDNSLNMSPEEIRGEYLEQNNMFKGGLETMIKAAISSGQYVAKLEDCDVSAVRNRSQQIELPGIELDGNMELFEKAIKEKRERGGAFFNSDDKNEVIRELRITHKDDFWNKVRGVVESRKRIDPNTISDKVEF